MVSGACLVVSMYIGWYDLSWCIWADIPSSGCAAAAQILLMRWCCWCADPADAPILLMRWSWWCTDADDALMLLMYWWCWCTDALMLLNQDQDLLADLSIAICSSYNCQVLYEVSVLCVKYGNIKKSPPCSISIYAIARIHPTSPILVQAAQHQRICVFIRNCVAFGKELQKFYFLIVTRIRYTCNIHGRM